MIRFLLRQILYSGRLSLFSKLFQHRGLLKIPLVYLLIQHRLPFDQHLIYAGFWVGKGIGIGPKSETTIAYSKSPETEVEMALPFDWL